MGNISVQVLQQIEKSGFLWLVEVKHSGPVILCVADSRRNEVGWDG